MNDVRMLYRRHDLDFTSDPDEVRARFDFWFLYRLDRHLYRMTGRVYNHRGMACNQYFTYLLSGLFVNT